MADGRKPSPCIEREKRESLMFAKDLPIPLEDNSVCAGNGRETAEKDGNRFQKFLRVRKWP